MSSETLAEIERRALEIVSDIEAKTGKYRAEIAPDCDPLWHAIGTAPSAERKAMHYLADRGFGVYLPRFERHRLSRGATRVSKVVLFPRHLFLFVWDIKRHWRRIKSCPGVQSILTIDERPVVVAEDMIDRMQALEFLQSALPVAPKRKRRRRREAINVDDNLPGSATISCRSYWDDLIQLDAPSRIGALHRALGLAS